MPRHLTEYNKFVAKFAKANPNLVGKVLMIEAGKAWKKVKGGFFEGYSRW